ncbi:MAG: hypothetical protein ABUK01_02685 [Leptospirales bacterium]
MKLHNLKKNFIFWNFVFWVILLTIVYVYNYTSKTSIDLAWTQLSKNSDFTNKKPEEWQAKKKFIGLLSILRDFEFIRCNSLKDCVESSNSNVLSVIVHPVGFSTKNKKGKPKEAIIYAISIANGKDNHVVNTAVADTVVALSYISTDASLNRSFSTLLEFAEKDLPHCSNKIQILFLPLVLDENFSKYFGLNLEHQLLYASQDKELQIYSTETGLKPRFLSTGISAKIEVPIAVTRERWRKFLCSNQEKGFSE